jgi:hypothetical protein
VGLGGGNHCSRLHIGLCYFLYLHDCMGVVNEMVTGDLYANSGIIKPKEER